MIDQTQAYHNVRAKTRSNLLYRHMETNKMGELHIQADISSHEYHCLHCYVL